MGITHNSLSCWCMYVFPPRLYRPACVRMNDKQLEYITPSTPMTLAALARETGALSEKLSKLETATNQVKTNFSEHVSQNQNGGCSHVRFPTLPVQQSDEQFLKPPARKFIEPGVEPVVSYYIMI